MKKNNELELRTNPLGHWERDGDRGTIYEIIQLILANPDLSGFDEHGKPAFVTVGAPFGDSTVERIECLTKGEYYQTNYYYRVLFDNGSMRDFFSVYSVLWVKVAEEPKTEPIEQLPY